jgi:hypothetical protein
MRWSIRVGVVLSLLAASWTPAVHAQGKFVNFETPQVKPIAVATLGSGASTRDWLLVCNTPDNSVEIYETTSPFNLVTRVPVGLGPVTVRWNAALGRFFVCNFDGDSVSMVRLQQSGSPPTLTVTLERTSHLGEDAKVGGKMRVSDEPCDIAFSTDNTEAYVTLNTRSAFVTISTTNLGVITRETTFDVPAVSPGIARTIKQPRQTEILGDGRHFALNFMGQNTISPTDPAGCDLDLWIQDGSTTRFVGGCGTTNHAFAISADGTKMFIVGTLAQNDVAAPGMPAVAALQTGFVQSRMWVVDVTSGSAPVVAPEPGSSTPATLFQSINLNRNYALTTLTEVSSSSALSQPTDVLLMETGSTVDKVILTAYHSDKIAFLAPSTSTVGGWAINRLTVPLLTTTGGYSVSGPRGLAMAKNAVDSATPSQPGILFVMNRLNNTIVAVNPHTETIITQKALANDPTPAVIREGRQFLYSADATSGNKMVACGSCHVDARTDGLAWDIGHDTTGPTIPEYLKDMVVEEPLEIPTSFPSEKGPLITQTLQGLVNWPMGVEMQVLMTNAPYHWRGDKNGFVDFNEAFVNLQGMANGFGTSSDPKGISDANMEKYRDFINTIMHPGNPEQDSARIITGDDLDTTNPDDVTAPTGERLGMLLFHNEPVLAANRSCVDCHSLPEGSGNTLTDFLTVGKTITSGSQEHPFETAAIRNVRQREMVWHDLDDYARSLSAVKQTMHKGLLHDGDFLITGAPSFLLGNLSINFFVHDIFATPLTAASAQGPDAVTEFVRRFDTGVAPIVGRAYTLKRNDATGNLRKMNEFEDQVEEANAGLAVYARVSGVAKGYWFDLTAAAPGYREEGTSTVVSQATVEGWAQTAGNLVILQCTPIGSERRFASLTGVETLISDTSNPPANVTLQPMAPNTAYVDVAKLSGNLTATPTIAISKWIFTTFHDSLLGQYGVASTRHHQPSRRFRVTGDHIRHGAKLVLGMPIFTPPTVWVAPIRLDLHPTKYAVGEGENRKQVWETHQEIDANITFAMLNGGLWAPGVIDTLLRATSTPAAYAPSTWNKYEVAVENEDGTSVTSGTLQALTIQDGR